MYKNKILISLFIISFLPVAVGLKADGNDILDQDDDLSYFDDLDFLDEYDHEFESHAPKRTLPDVDQLLPFLLEIKEPLWKNTKSPVGRDVLYLIPHRLTALEYGGTSFNLFFNMTDHMKVTANDLINFDAHKDLLQAILEIVPKQTDSFDVQQLFPLVKKLTIQEIKSGVLLHAGWVCGCFMVQIQSALQMGVRNFWLSKKDQREIKDLMETAFGKASTLDERELYRIRFGLGDTRLKFGVNAINVTSFQSDFGFEFILPTSTIGHGHRLKVGVDTTTSEDSAIQSLRSIRDYLIEPRLGNNGHFGIGCYWESKINVFHNLAQLWTRLSYDKLLPAQEDRLLLYKTTVTPEQLGDAGPGDVSLINDFIKQYIFPTSFRVTTYPGGVINGVIAVTFSAREKFRSTYGYDFYAQQRERIKMVHNTQASLSDLRDDDATSGIVSQHKFFSETMYIKKCVYGDLGIGLGFDTTLVSEGIGKDWTVFVKVAASF